MRLHRLKAAEAEALGSPREIDSLGEFALAFGDRWSGDDIYVLVSAFVDESGTGGEPVMVMGVLMAPMTHWATFSDVWNQLLDRAQIPYAHYTEMHHNKGHYGDDWNIAKKSDWCNASFRIVESICTVGFTVSLDQKLYRDVYRPGLPHPYSAYGVCAREVYGQALANAKELWGPDVVVNFAFEKGHKNSGGAADIFNDLIRCNPDDAPNFGKFGLIDKKRAAGLQAADHIAACARMSEARAIAEDAFIPVPEGTSLADIRKIDPSGSRCPLFYYGIQESGLEWHREQTLAMARKKRWLKRQEERALKLALEE